MQKLLTLYFLMLLFSCRQAPALTENEKSVIIDSVQHTLNSYFKDIKTSGLLAEFIYLDHSPDFFWVPPGYGSAISYDSVAAILRKSAAKYTAINNVFDTLHIIALSKELATYTGRLHSTMTDTSGTTLHFSLLETGVMIKRPGGWKLLNGQTSMTTHTDENNH
ncbi:MAG: nuclear transport factor 2 family protein [Sediminibacterium sp.]